MMPVSSVGNGLRRVGDPADQMWQARRLPYVSRNRWTLNQTDLVAVTLTQMIIVEDWRSGSDQLPGRNSVRT